MIIRRDEYNSIEEMALAVSDTSIEMFMNGVLKDFIGSMIQSDEDSSSATNKYNLQKLNPEMSDNEAA